MSSMKATAGMYAQRAIPRYTQIAGLLRSQLEAGAYAVGDRLPSIDRLAESFQVAPQTMRQAIALLESEGLVRRRHGVGTIVEAEPREQRWLTIPTDWDSLISTLDGFDPRLLLVESRERTPHVDPGHGKLLGSYKYLKRVHYRGDAPFAIVGAYLGNELYMRAPKLFRTRMILPAIDRIKEIKIAKATQTLRVNVADAETANHLDIPIASPVVQVRRLLINPDNEIIYVADISYRGDVVAIDMDLSPSRGD